MSEIGYCSRRGADKLIAARRVTVNGRLPEVGAQIDPARDTVAVDGKEIGGAPVDRVYIALNKPVGIVCTTDTRVEPDNIVDFVGFERRIFPIGRLDKPSEGLIFLTNDGDMVNKVLRAGNNHEKEYEVTVDKPVTKGFLRRMGAGVPVLGQITRECEVWGTGERTFTIVLTQGLNRQIRRMCEFLGYRVTKLKRVRVMHMRLDTPEGRWRHFSEAEVAELNRLVRHSSKLPHGAAGGR